MEPKIRALFREAVPLFLFLEDGETETLELSEFSKESPLDIDPNDLRLFLELAVPNSTSKSATADSGSIPKNLA